MHLLLDGGVLLLHVPLLFGSINHQLVQLQETKQLISQAYQTNWSFDDSFSFSKGKYVLNSFFGSVIITQVWKTSQRLNVEFWPNEMRDGSYNYT